MSSFQSVILYQEAQWLEAQSSRVQSIEVQIPPLPLVLVWLYDLVIFTIKVVEIQLPTL